MLAKLLKYEFRATARVLCPLYLALIVMSFIERLFIHNNYKSEISDILAVISTIIYAIIIAASFIVTLVIIINRFRKNLLLDEGYLMNTLPVESWKNILSKLIVATIWSIVSTMVGIVSVLILIYQQGFMNEFLNGVNMIIDECYGKIGALSYVLVIEIIVLSIIAIMKETTLIYAAICIGNLAKQRKVLAGFGSYIGLNIVTSSVTSILHLNIDYSFLIEGTNISINGLSTSYLLSIVIEFILFIVYFLITNYILKNKLNLQ